MDVFDNVSMGSNSTRSEEDTGLTFSELVSVAIIGSLGFAGKCLK